MSTFVNGKTLASSQIRTLNTQVPLVPYQLDNIGCWGHLPTIEQAINRNKLKLITIFEVGSVRPVTGVKHAMSIEITAFYFQCVFTYLHEYKT